MGFFLKRRDAVLNTNFKTLFANNKKSFFYFQQLMLTIRTVNLTFIHLILLCLKPKT